MAVPVMPVARITAARKVAFLFNVPPPRTFSDKTDYFVSLFYIPFPSDFLLTVFCIAISIHYFISFV